MLFKNFFTGISLAVLCFAGLLSAQKEIKSDKVPEKITEDFERKFPEAKKVTWYDQDGELFVAEFQEKKLKTIVIYNTINEWMQTEEEMVYKELDDSVRFYLNDHYQGYKAYTVRKVTTRKYGVLYEVEIANKEEILLITFDRNAKIVDEKRRELN